MSRKAKGPGYTPRSGKSPAFKNMGSSPVKYTSALTGEELNPYAPNVIDDMQAMGVSSDVMQKIIENKTKGEIEDKKNRTEKGTNVDLKKEVEKSVKKVDKIKKIKPKKTDMDELRAKQRRMSKGQSEYQYRNSKEYKDSKKTKGLKDLSGTTGTDSVDLTRKTDGAPIAGGSGSKTSYSPPETSKLSFSDVNDNTTKLKQKPYEVDEVDVSEIKKSKYFSDRSKFVIDKDQDNIRDDAQGTTSYDPYMHEGFETYWERKKKIERQRELNELSRLANESAFNKKSPYKKGIGKYAKKAKGSRGFKMKK